MHKRIFYIVVGGIITFVIVLTGAWLWLDKVQSKESLNFETQIIRHIAQDYSSLNGMTLAQSQPLKTSCEEDSAALSLNRDYICKVTTSLLLVASPSTDLHAVEADIQSKLEQQPFTRPKFAQAGSQAPSVVGLADELAHDGSWMGVYYGSNDQLQISFRFVGPGNSGRLLEKNQYTLVDSEADLPRLVDKLNAQQRQQDSLLEIDITDPYDTCRSFFFPTCLLLVAKDPS